MLELEAAQRAPKTNEAQWQARLQNAQAAVNNFNKYLAEDRKMEKALLGRMEKARRELDGAKEALAQ